MSRNLKIIIVSFLVFLGISMFIYKFRTTQKPPVVDDMLQIDIDDDGVYKNYKYEYIFLYPRNKFELQSSTGEFASWNYILDNDNYLVLGTLVYNNEVYENMWNIYQNNKAADYNKDIYNVLFEENISDNVFKTVVYSRTVKDLQIDGNSSYAASWWFKRQKRLVEVVLYTRNSDQGDNFLKMNKHIFDEVEKSLKFEN